MKKVMVMGGVVLFFLLILVAVLFKFLAPKHTASTSQISFPVATEPTGITEQNPELFVKSFYQWYLLNFSRDPLFPHPENRNVVLGPWLTDKYLAQWDNILYDVEINPVLQSAEDPRTWGSGLSTRTVEQSIRTRTVYVTIGEGTTLHALNIKLVQDTEGNWKIDEVLGENQ